MRAALLTKLNAPLELCDLEPCELQFGQVLVKIIVSGICGAQLQEISGQKSPKIRTLSGEGVNPLPRPLGHEACGIVEAIGPGVKQVKVGDKAVCHWRKGAGIESDFPLYFQLADESIITGGLIATFMEKAVISENRLTAVPQDTPDELCALLGCGLSTALATMENEAHLLRGESVLIVGCGGLGTNLILAAKLTGAWPIISADITPKEGLAKELGATNFWYFNHPPPHGLHFDVIIDTTGNRHAIERTLPLLAPSGRFVMVGQPKEAFTVENPIHFFDGKGKSIRATQGGQYEPNLDCRRYAKFFAHYDPIPDFLVSHRFKLEEINQALDVVRGGNASRVMIYP